MDTLKKLLFLSIASLIAAINLTGCASTTNNKDPYESFNRHMFNFNLAIDHSLVRPISRGYNFITPNFVQHRVTNVYSNIGDVANTANDLFQLNMRQMAWDAWRVALNSTLGIGGLFDIAATMGLSKHHNDFGLTMARWGWTDSNYLILPILGPRTVRDAIGTVPDTAMTPWPYVQPWELGFGLHWFQIINNRAALLPYDKLLDNAFNPYVALRNGYMQNRRAKVNAIQNAKTADISSKQEDWDQGKPGLTTVATGPVTTENVDQKSTMADKKSTPPKSS